MDDYFITSTGLRPVAISIERSDNVISIERSDNVISTERSEWRNLQAIIQNKK